MVGELAYALAHAVPFNITALLLKAEMDDGLVREDALGEIGVRLRREVDIEGALCPTGGRPALTLAEIVDSTPIGKADDAVEVHLVVIGPHAHHGGFALVEHHPWEASSVAGEIHISIIICRDVSFIDKGRGQRVGFLRTTARVHGYGDETCIIVTSEQRFHHTIRRDPPIVVR